MIHRGASEKVLLGIFSAGSICLSFLFQVLIFTTLGVGIETDALFAGMTIPQLVLSIISASLTHSLIPILAGKSSSEAKSDSWAFMALIFLLFGALGVVLGLTMNLWLPVTLPGFDVDKLSLTETLSKIQLIAMVFMAINGVQIASYHAGKKFIWAELSSCVTTFGAILYLILSSHNIDVETIAWISSIRIILQVVLMLPGMGWPTISGMKQGTFIKTWRSIKPLLVGTSYFKTEMLVDRYLLSSAANGVLSEFNFAQQLISSSSQFLNKVLVAPLAPELALNYKNKDINGFKYIFYKGILYSTAIPIIAIIIFFIFGENLIGAILNYGNFQDKNITNIWVLILLLSGVSITANSGQVCSIAFYSMENSRTPVKMSIITYSIYIPIKFIIFIYFGVIGLAISISLYFFCNFLIQFLLINKHLKKII